MALFGRKKTKEETCGCAGTCKGKGQDTNAGTESIKVLGAGCPKCKKLEAATKAALAELGMDEAVGHVTDYAEIAAYGVMSTPALVVDEKVVSYGKVLDKDEVVALLKKERG